jgi:hypothetical protein
MKKKIAWTKEEKDRIVPQSFDKAFLRGDTDSDATTKGNMSGSRGFFFKGGFFGFFLFTVPYVRYSTLLNLLPLRFHCVGGC